LLPDGAAADGDLGGRAVAVLPLQGLAVGAG
jgi:hypothetical protein